MWNFAEGLIDGGCGEIKALIGTDDWDMLRRGWRRCLSMERLDGGPEVTRDSGRP